MKNWPDWLIRAAKTFVQAFLGVFLPAIISVLNGGFPIDWSAAKITIVSALMAALAAGISAVWNIALEVHSDLKAPEVETMIDKEDRAELQEYFDARYKLKEECDTEMQAVAEKQSKHETQFAVINTKLSAILWLLGVVGAAVIGAIIKGLGG